MKRRVGCSSGAGGGALFRAAAGAGLAGAAALDGAGSVGADAGFSRTSASTSASSSSAVSSGSRMRCVRSGSYAGARGGTLFSLTGRAPPGGASSPDSPVSSSRGTASRIRCVRSSSDTARRAVPKLGGRVDARKNAAPSAVVWQLGHSRCPSRSSTETATTWLQVGHRPWSDPSPEGGVIACSDGAPRLSPEATRGRGLGAELPIRRRAGVRRRSCSGSTARIGRAPTKPERDAPIESGLDGAILRW